MKNHRSLMFFTSVLYSMADKWKGIGTSESFQNILDSKKDISLTFAFVKLKKEGLLGEFSEDFRQVSGGIRTSNIGDIISEMFEYLLIRADGDYYFCHLDCVNPEGLERIIEENNLPKDLIEKASKRLNEILDEMERETKTPEI